MMARILFFVLLLSLALLLAAGAYLYQNFSPLIRDYSDPYLEPYGLQDLRVSRPRVGPDRSVIQQLTVAGDGPEYRFEVRARGLRVDYYWLDALQGRPRALHIDQLQVIFTQRATDGDAEVLQVTLSQLLQQYLQELLSVPQISIGELQLDYERPGMPTVQVAGALRLQDTLLADLRSHYQGVDANLSVTLDPVTSAISANLDIKDKTPLLTLSLSTAGRRDQFWEWQIKSDIALGPVLEQYTKFTKPDIPANANLAPESLNVTGSGSLAATLRHPDNITWDPANPLSLLRAAALNLTAAIAITELHYADLFDADEMQLTGSLYLNETDWQLELPAMAASLRLNTASAGLTAEQRDLLGWNTWELIQWQHNEPLTLNGLMDGEDLVLNARAAKLGIGELSRRWQLSGLQLDATLSGNDIPQLRAQANARLQASIDGQSLPDLHLTAQHNGPLDNGSFHFTATDPDSATRLLLTGAGNTLAGEGEFSLDLSSPDLASASASLSPVIKQLSGLQSLPTLSGGSLQLHSDLQAAGWEEIDRWRQQAQLTISDLGGSYQDYQFSAVDMTARWRGIDTWQTVSPITLRVASLDSAIPAQNIRARFALPNPTPATSPAVNLLSFSAETLGGRIFLPEEQRWDFSSASNQLQLKVENWQLEELVALQQSDQIGASGTLSGLLPFALTEGRIVIENGFLQNDSAGGTIQYTPDASGAALGQSSSELAGALNLLGDFHYKVLSSKVNLDPAGNLLLALSLSGRNPAEYEGRQINFNINLEQNIDPLLQSLRLSDSVVRQLEKNSQ